MKVELFADVTGLKAGDTVAGPSALTELGLFGGIGTPLYKVVAVVNWRFLWFKRHYAKIRRISDGEVIKINLDPPAFDWTWAAPPGPPIDNRLNWARLEFSQ